MSTLTSIFFSLAPCTADNLACPTQPGIDVISSRLTTNLGQSARPGCGRPRGRVQGPVCRTVDRSETEAPSRLGMSASFRAVLTAASVAASRFPNRRLGWFVFGLPSSLRSWRQCLGMRTDPHPGRLVSGLLLASTLEKTLPFFACFRNFRATMPRISQPNGGPG